MKVFSRYFNISTSYNFIAMDDNEFKLLFIPYLLHNSTVHSYGIQNAHFPKKHKLRLFSSHPLFLSPTSILYIFSAFGCWNGFNVHFHHLNYCVEFCVFVFVFEFVCENDYIDLIVSNHQITLVQLKFNDSVRCNAFFFCSFDRSLTRSFPYSACNAFHACFLILLF